MSNLLLLPTKEERYCDGFIRMVENIAKIEGKEHDEVLSDIHDELYKGASRPVHNVYQVIEADDDMSLYTLDQLGISVEEYINW